MEPKHNITIGSEAQQKFLTGIEYVSSVIRQSYGPKGGNVSVEQYLYPFHGIYNDAQSIIQAIQVEDPVERRGLNFVKELSDKASKDSGEGRKTTIIIAEEILKGGFEANIRGMKLKEELDALLPQVLKSLDEQSQKVELADIGKVAETASRSREIGEVIGRIYQEIGREGIIDVEGSSTPETHYETTEGVNFNMGWASRHMGYGDNPQKAVYEKPTILVSRLPIENNAEIDSFMSAMVNAGNRKLVFLVEHIAPAVVDMMVAMHRTKQIALLVLKAPTLWKDEVIDDFAKCAGASVLEPGGGVTWKTLVRNIQGGAFKLGTCDKLIADAEDTLLLGIHDLTEYKKELQAKVDNDRDNDAKRRLWRLNAKTAILKIGASSESELSYKLLKAKDATNSCRAALAEGVVEGAGWALDRAALGIANPILRDALRAPRKQLRQNNEGNELDEDVKDATLIVKNAVRNAISLAGIVLTTAADIHARKPTAEEIQVEMIMKQRYNL